MNELTRRLSDPQPVIVGGADLSVDELRNRIGNIGYVLVKFTETRGGTEIGFPLDRACSGLSSADFDNSSGTVHVEGVMTLNGDPVRCVADVGLADLKGTGHLVPEGKETTAEG